MNIQLHIERIILDGLPIPGDQRALVQAAVEAELVGLLSTNGLAITSSGAMERITANEIQVQPDTTARQLGRQIARSVHASLDPSGRADQSSKRALPQSVPASSATPMPQRLQPSPSAKTFNASG